MDDDKSEVDIFSANKHLTSQPNISIKGIVITFYLSKMSKESKDHWFYD